MKRSLSAFLLLVLLTPTLAIAEEPASLRRSIAHVNFQGPGLPVRPPTLLSPRRAPIPGRAHCEIVYGVAGAVAGSLAGGIIGGALDRNCRCDDPGLGGIMIGVPIGAAIGAVVGVILASR